MNRHLSTFNGKLYRRFLVYPNGKVTFRQIQLTFFHLTRTIYAKDLDRLFYGFLQSCFVIAFGHVI